MLALVLWLDGWTNNGLTNNACGLEKKIGRFTLMACTSTTLGRCSDGEKVGSVPSTVTTADIELMAINFTSKEQEAVVNACTIMGFLNRFM